MTETQSEQILLEKKVAVDLFNTGCHICSKGKQAQYLWSAGKPSAIKWSMPVTYWDIKH